MRLTHYTGTTVEECRPITNMITMLCSACNKPLGLDWDFNKLRQAVHKECMNKETTTTGENIQNQYFPTQTWPYQPMPYSNPCPGCGRCPTCGRGGYYPYQPYWKYDPVTSPQWTYTSNLQTANKNIQSIN